MLLSIYYAIIYIIILSALTYSMCFIDVKNPILDARMGF